MARTCCQAVVQSTTEEWDQDLAQGSAAVPCCWVTTDLYEKQIFIGVIAVAPAFRQAVLQSTIGQWE